MNMFEKVDMISKNIGNQNDISQNDKNASSFNQIDLSRILSDYTPSYSGIVCGLSKGEFYLNDLKQPTAAVVYSEPVGGFSILGNLDNDEELQELNRFLKEDLFQTLRSKEWDEFEFSIEDTIMSQKILSMFEDKEINSEIEYSFRMGSKQTAKYSISSDYQIVPVNATLIESMEQDKIENSALILDIIHNSWYQYEDFLRWSLGFVAIYQNKVVAAIVGTSRFRQYVSIDIITEEEHRKKGLASALTLTFDNECRKRGLISHWDCVESNLASQKTAQKCGFELLRKRNYYWFSI